MAMIHLATATQNALAAVIRTKVDAGSSNGYFEIYAADGDGIPANANTAVTDQTLLGTLTFSDPSFGTESGGVITAAAITGDTSADATADAAWARIYDSDDNVVTDLDVTDNDGSGYIKLNSISITAGGLIDIASFTFTFPDGT